MSVYFQKQSPKVFFKKGVLKNFANFSRKKLHWSLFLIKLQAWRPHATLSKETLTQKFSCEISKIFKNTYF